MSAGLKLVCRGVKAARTAVCKMLPGRTLVRPARDQNSNIVGVPGEERDFKSGIAFDTAAMRSFLVACGANEI
jgi:hypothetical protein